MNLSQGDELTLLLGAAQVDRIPVASLDEALQVLDEYEDVERFRYEDGVLEVVQR